jgi:hypothetical protein
MGDVDEGLRGAYVRVYLGVGLGIAGICVLGGTIILLGSYPLVALPSWLLPTLTVVGLALGISALILLGTLILQLRRLMRTP